jgi:hypothetical protein
MKLISSRELLRDPGVINEINRYKWIQSEKVGSDIGFERASRDWINSYSGTYLNHHPGKATSMLITNFFNTEIHITVK